MTDLYISAAIILLLVVLVALLYWEGNKLRNQLADCDIKLAMICPSDYENFITQLHCTRMDQLLEEVRHEVIDNYTDLEAYLDALEQVRSIDEVAYAAHVKRHPAIPNMEYDGADLVWDAVTM